MPAVNGDTHLLSNGLPAEFLLRRLASGAFEFGLHLVAFHRGHRNQASAAGRSGKSSRSCLRSALDMLLVLRHGPLCSRAQCGTGAMDRSLL